MKNVIYAPEVVDDLLMLIEILVADEYLSTYDQASSYAQDIIDYIRSVIDTYPAKIAPARFHRYGNSLRYIPYKRNQRTTWYIMFETHPDCYFVTYITNNHVSGQYFNQ